MRIKLSNTVQVPHKVFVQVKSSSIRFQSIAELHNSEVRSALGYILLQKFTEAWKGLHYKGLLLFLVLKKLQMYMKL